MKSETNSPINWHDYIVCDPAILCGKPTLKGTRLSVEFVLDLLAGGWTRKDLAENYPNLTDERLRAILAYAADMTRKTNGQADAFRILNKSPQFEFRFPVDAELNALPHFPLVMQLMAYFEALNSAVRWAILISNEPSRTIVDDLDQFVAVFAGASWTHEAFQFLRKDKTRKVFTRSMLIERADTLAFYDRILADPPDRMIKAVEDLRNKYFGHFDPRVLTKFVNWQDQNRKPTAFCVGDNSGNASGCRYLWPIEACIFDLHGGLLEGNYTDRTDVVFADFKAVLRGTIGLLVALVEVWMRQNNLLNRDSWHITRLS